jgi:hypothetical protein
VPITGGVSEGGTGAYHLFENVINSIVPFKTAGKHRVKLAVDSEGYVFDYIEVKPVITVLEPNGGEVYRVGDTMTIRWETDEYYVGDVHVQISIDTGKTWPDLTKLTKGISCKNYDKTCWENFRWKISDSIYGVSTANEKVRVKIRKYGDNLGIFDVSDNVFTILPSVGAHNSVSGKADETFRMHRGGSRVEFQLPSGDGIYTITLHTLFGRKICSARVEGKKRCYLDLSQYPSGPYLISVTSTRGVRFNKYIVSAGK